KYAADLVLVEPLASPTFAPHRPVAARSHDGRAPRAGDTERTQRQRLARRRTGRSPGAGPGPPPRRGAARPADAARGRLADRPSPAGARPAPPDRGDDGRPGRVDPGGPDRGRRLRRQALRPRPLARRRRRLPTRPGKPTPLAPAPPSWYNGTIHAGGGPPSPIDQHSERRYRCRRGRCQMEEPGRPTALVAEEDPAVRELLREALGPA